MAVPFLVITVSTTVAVAAVPTFPIYRHVWHVALDAAKSIGTNGSAIRQTAKILVMTAVTTSGRVLDCFLRWLGAICGGFEAARAVTAGRAMPAHLVTHARREHRDVIRHRAAVVPIAHRRRPTFTRFPTRSNLGMLRRYRRPRPHRILQLRQVIEFDVADLSFH